MLTLRPRQDGVNGRYNGSVELNGLTVCCVELLTAAVRSIKLNGRTVCRVELLTACSLTSARSVSAITSFVSDTDVHDELSTGP